MTHPHRVRKTIKKLTKGPGARRGNPLREKADKIKGFTKGQLKKVGTKGFTKGKLKKIKEKAFTRGRLKRVTSKIRRKRVAR